MAFPKKSSWNMIFLVLSVKMIFLFPENIILFFRRKMKDDLSKKMIFSSNVLKRWSFQKNRTGIWSFLLYCMERWYFFFPKMWSYSLDGKWKIIFPQKNTWKYHIFFKCPEKMVFLKKITLEYNLPRKFEKMVFFFRKISYFFFGRKMKDDLSQEIHGNMIFSVYMYKCYKHDITLLQKKVKD